MVDHAPLVDGWSLWRWCQVRGAGFPIDMVLGLATPGAESAWDAARVVSRREIRAIAADPKFREAITWQNRKAVTEGLDSLLRQPEDANDARSRRKELTVVSYLQRYCAKNDTIGFFGPIGWGRVGDGRDFRCAVGKSLTARRTVYLEPWALRAFAQVYGSAPQVRVHLRPQLAPALRVDGDRLLGVAGARSLDGSEAVEHPELLAACDGTRAAMELAEQFSSTRGLPDADDVFNALKHYADRGWLIWDITVPSHLIGWKALVDKLAQIPDEDARASAFECAVAIQKARDAVRDAAGTPELSSRIAALEETFTEITGSAASRNGGQTYAGRTIAFEDCVRDVDVDIGAVVRERMAAPLALLLQSARWFTHDVGKRHFEFFVETLRGMVPDGEWLFFPRFWHAVGPYFAEATPTLFSRASEELQARWARVLDGKPAHASVKLRARVRDVFAAPHPGWPSARHHCPDVMIAAPGVDAILRGAFSVVIGELHAGLCVFNTQSATLQARDLDALRTAYDDDIGPGIAPVAVDNFTRSSHDSHLAMNDIHIETIPDVPSWRPRSNVVRLGDLRVRIDGKRAIVQHVDGRSWDLMQVMERPIKTRAAVAFNPFPSSGERITIDDVVLARRRWTLSASHVQQFSSDDARTRFTGARAVARELGLPRFVFVKVPTEVKPIFVDLESVPLVELMARMARNAASVTVSEMLPGPDQCWLPLPDGKRCTSELRMIAVDPVRWRPFELE